LGLIIRFVRSVSAGLLGFLILNLMLFETGIGCVRDLEGSDSVAGFFEILGGVCLLRGLS
jgi:hypothetical protein